MNTCRNVMISILSFVSICVLVILCIIIWGFNSIYSSINDSKESEENNGLATEIVYRTQVVSTNTSEENESLEVIITQVESSPPPVASILTPISEEWDFDSEDQTIDIVGNYSDFSEYIGQPNCPATFQIDYNNSTYLIFYKGQSGSVRIGQQFVVINYDAGITSILRYKSSGQLEQMFVVNGVCNWQGYSNLSQRRLDSIKARITPLPD